MMTSTRIILLFLIFTRATPFRSGRTSDLTSRSNLQTLNCFDSQDNKIGESLSDKCDSISINKLQQHQKDLFRVDFDVKRFLAYNILAAGLALGSNFCGVTSWILSSDPIFFSNLKLDQLYSIDGYRRLVNSEDGYEFKFPDNWVADQSVLLAKIKRNEILTSFGDYQPQQRRPDIAYGVEGSQRRENLSILKSKVTKGFTVDILGPPEVAADKLLANVIAPPSSGKSYRLLNAFGDYRNNKPAYSFEYTIDKGAEIHQHCISVIMSNADELFTLTTMAPQEKWDTEGNKIAEIAKSFQLQ